MHIVTCLDFARLKKHYLFISKFLFSQETDFAVKLEKNVFIALTQLWGLLYLLYA